MIRTDPRDELAAVGRSVVAARLVVGSGGNLSARVPGTDECWITGTGTWLDRLDRSSFARVRVGDGVPLDAVRPSSELALHLGAYRRRPDVAAVVHLHPQAVLLLDALGVPVRLVTTDHAYYLRRVVTTPFRLPGSVQLAEVAADASVDADVVVLAYHGCSVLADSVELAHKRALYLEEAAQLTYRALALGRLAYLPDCPAEFVTRLDAPGNVV